MRRHDIDAIVLTASRHRLPLLEHLLGVGDRTPAVLELSDLYERAFGCVPVEEINAAWFIEALTLHRRLQASVARRIVDIAVATVAAVVTAPLMLLVALAVKLDSPGPVFYRQVRVGEGGRRFTIIKFRSMRTDAEASGAPQWASERDPRITRVGAFIRRFRIDELPQLWNVVRGEMALVGPRPERPELVAEIARQLPFYEPRHLVRPGITGWAQVYAPYAASIEETLEKLSYDLYYVKHQSFATDAGIMLSTLGSHGRRTWGPLAAENREKGRVFMRTTRFILPLVALALCVMPAVALASNGGTTQAIVKDVAKDGKVDGHYTTGAAQVRAQEPAAQAVRRPGCSRVGHHEGQAQGHGRAGHRRGSQPAVHGLRRVPLRRSSVAVCSQPASCSGALAGATTRLRPSHPSAASPAAGRGALVAPRPELFFRPRASSAR